MDNLREIVHTLTDEDCKEFRVFINRQKLKKNRLDLVLFDVMLENRTYKPKEIINRLYPDSQNKEAYHALRKRLIKHLIDFIVVKRMDDDITTDSSIMGLVSLSQYLFDHKSIRLGWHHLKKAEELAVKGNQYGLLNLIYNIGIQNHSPEYGGALDSLISYREVNRKLVEEDEQALIANAVIKNKLEACKINGLTTDIDKLVEDVLDRFGLTTAMYRRPKLLYNIVSIMRSSIVARKDYYIFEPYVIDLFSKVEQYHGFTKYNHYYKLSFLYIIAHVLYRNKKFDEALEWLSKMDKNLKKFHLSHYEFFFPKYIMLLSSVKNYQGQNFHAIQLTENVLQSKNNLSLEDINNIQLNLCVFYFQKGVFRKANQILMEINHSDAFLNKKMGREWVLRRSLVDMIIQYELGNDDIALNRLVAIEKHYATMFATERYQRVLVFLALVRKYFRDPFYVSNPDFREKLETSLEKLPAAQEDIQAMAFYCWLKAKMLNVNYYKLLIETTMINPIELVSS